MFLVVIVIHPLYSQDTKLRKLDSTFLSVDTALVKDSVVLKKSADSTANILIQLKPPSVLKVISVGKVIWAIIFLIIGLYIIRLITKILEIFAERSTSYRITIKGIVPIVRIFGWMLVIYIVIAGIFRPPFATVIAVTASVGIAVGFAAQDIIKNIIGGIMILFDHPFQVGDKIQLGEYYGEVIKIGLSSTKIVTPDDSTVTIPNGEMMNKSVSNANYGEPNCQVVAEIYLPIDIDTDRVRQIAIEAAQVSKYVYLNKSITVLFFNEIKDRKAYLKMRLKAYVMDIRYEFQFKSDMTELVMKELLIQQLISTEDYN
jgi:small-conductance mechanosensitive channel